MLAVPQIFERDNDRLAVNNLQLDICLGFSDEAVINVLPDRRVELRCHRLVKVLYGERQNHLIMNTAQG